jgi:hypothetical protein
MKRPWREERALRLKKRRAPKTKLGPKMLIISNIKKDAWGCWVWQKSRSKGYGRARNPRTGKMDGTHRIAWELFVGTIPEGFHVDHVCENTACCNPKHLEPVPAQENLRRGRVNKVFKKRIVEGMAS